MSSMSSSLFDALIFPTGKHYLYMYPPRGTGIYKITSTPAKIFGW